MPIPFAQSPKREGGDSMLSPARTRAPEETGAPFLPAFGRSGDFDFEVDLILLLTTDHSFCHPEARKKRAEGPYDRQQLRRSTQDQKSMKLSNRPLTAFRPAAIKKVVNKQKSRRDY